MKKSNDLSRFAVKPWHVTMARYNAKLNGCAERRVKDFTNDVEALAYLNAHADKPIYVWHDDAVNLDNPYFAICETDAYKNENKKCID